MAEWKHSDLPRLNMTWRCSACGVTQASGRSCRVIPIDGADLDEILCASCDHDDAERIVIENRRTRDVAAELQFERDEISQSLERYGVPFLAPDERPYKLVERVAVLARWATGGKRRR